VTERSTAELRILGIDGIPEITPQHDLHGVIGDAIEASGHGLTNDDVLVVTHKIVSKAEGRLVDLREVIPSDFARRWAERFDKDPRQVEVVLGETKRIVRMDRGVLIAETHHGFICANAGVDQSNVRSETVCLLPVDPDASAAAIRAALAARFGLDGGPGIVISDSFGRPWRAGIVNVAVGVAGIAPLADYRGMFDSAGYELHVSVLAVADELAAAAELVMNKLDARPVVLIRGYQLPTGSVAGTARDMVLDPSRDLFR
jgi:coenzyme F420-0:L-glutamate ligase/coenzyme F420-1:gamma-L-glutamate ligase